MALTSKQRNALPDSAFVYPSRRAYPVPTKAQAAKAGIGERQRIGMHRNALSRAAQSNTSGSTGKVRGVVAKRAGGKVASVKGHPRARNRKS
jgi:hypothetical protein